jgi:uncharacterized protein (DUF58 family)
MTAHLAQARTLLRIPAHRRVASLLEGEYVALHPGRSTEFTDLREYVPGDDPKDLDWKASARARTLLVRRYHALRKLTLHLVVATGRSMRAVSPQGAPKYDVAVTVAGVLGDLAARHGDLVGVVHGDGAEQTLLPARGGTAHLERCLRSAREAAEAADGPTDLAGLLHRVVGSVRRRGTVVVIADVVEVDAAAAAELRRLQVRHEVLVVLVRGLDPTDPDPDLPRAVLDADDDGPVPAWLRDDPLLRRQLAARVAEDRQRLDTDLNRLRISHVHVDGHDDVVPALRRLLERHRRDGRR